MKDFGQTSALKFKSLSGYLRGKTSPRQQTAALTLSQDIDSMILLSAVHKFGLGSGDGARVLE